MMPVQRPTAAPRTTQAAVREIAAAVAITILLLGLGGCDRGAPPATDADGVPAKPVSRGHSDEFALNLDPDAPRPTTHVVMVLIDTLRADRVGAYGYDRPTTPELDAVAAEGVVFEQAYAPAPWTLPSIPSLFTSTFACEHNVVREGQKLRPGIPTLAERFRALDYATAQFYCNGFAAKTTGLDRGFQTSVRPRPAANGAVIAPWLAEHADTPFFLYLHNMEPHKPHASPAAFVEALGGGAGQEEQRAIRRFRVKYRNLAFADFTAERPLGTSDHADAMTAVLEDALRSREAYSKLYDAAVRWGDYELGTIVAALKEHDLWDDTLFIVLADHGEELGDHGGYLHGQSLYEELLRVPLVVKLPRGVFAGVRVRQPVSLVDVLPTIFGVLERPDAARGARGRDLLPIVRQAGGSDGGARDANRESAQILPVAVRDDRKLYYRPWAETRGQINVALRQGKYKAIWSEDTGRIELYDLAADPHEQYDLSHDDPARATALAAFAKAWWETCRAQSDASIDVGLKGLGKETQKELETLGYIAGDEEPNEGGHTDD